MGIPETMRRLALAGQRWGALLAEGAFPHVCLACDRAVKCSDRQVPEPFCPECAESIWPISPGCPLCGAPRHTHEMFESENDLLAHRCGDCARNPPAFDWARSAFAYGEAMKDAIVAIKWRGLRMPAGALWPRTHQNGWLGEPCPLLENSEIGASPVDCVVPVGGEHRRTLRRGYNPAALLATTWASRLGVPLRAGLLVRTRSQDVSAGAGRKQRQERVLGAFCVREPAEVKERRILLVDDVYTSGATARECSRVLRRAGAAWVGVITLARAVDQP